MAMAKEMMQGGCSAGQAKAINGFQNLTISAAGTALATATALTTSHNVVTTCAAGAGVSLPSGEISDEIFLFNNTVNPCLVYPEASGSTINQLGAGIAATVPAYSGALFKKASSTAWWAISG